MNVDYINPFINASLEVVKTFAGIDSAAGRPLVRPQPATGGDIKGFITLNGHGINGYFIISFTRAFLEDILAALFDGGPVSGEEVDDLAGELTNMISGSAKAQLSEKGFFFDVAVPKISHTMPMIPDDLKSGPVIIVPFDSRAGKYFIQASIKKIEEAFATDTMPEIDPPDGHISVETFARRTRMDQLKVRRFLKTGFLQGKKISNRQWHIPETELNKIQGYRPTKRPARTVEADTDMDKLVSAEQFARLSGLSTAKVKSFLRTGFLKGRVDESKKWRVYIDQVSKFKT